VADLGEPPLPLIFGEKRRNDWRTKSWQGKWNKTGLPPYLKVWIRLGDVTTTTATKKQLSKHHSSSSSLNYSKYLCRTHINFLSLILTDSWILVKILEPNCLPPLSNCKIEKTTVQLLFSLFIQFSTIEIRSVLPHAKLMISWLKWLEKKSGLPELVSKL